jgi:hypothetical protein
LDFDVPRLQSTYAFSSGQKDDRAQLALRRLIHLGTRRAAASACYVEVERSKHTAMNVQHLDEQTFFSSGYIGGVLDEA